MGAIMGFVYERLTKRELEILYHISECRKNSEISSILFISCHTVETHKSNIIKKMQLKNSTELIGFAIQNKDKISRHYQLLK